MRTLLTRMSCALAALALTLSASSSASAEPYPVAREITESTTASIARSTKISVNEIQRTATAAINTIHNLSENGAPDEVLAEAAQRYTTAVNTLSRSARAETDRLTRAALGALNALEAPDRFAATVATANKSANLTIAAAAELARRTIHQALQDALAEQDEGIHTLPPKTDSGATNARAA